ncbi:hypothetical protein SDC9_187250 [bioreactor metagenome]|uniref:Uncharacterized protein n=1 Tax=bioreactor metagenome TaxID=1076179 RepID=A0A645HL55_9ZZZZ
MRHVSLSLSKSVRCVPSSSCDSARIVALWRIICMAPCLSYGTTTSSFTCVLASASSIACRRESIPALLTALMATPPLRGFASGLSILLYTSILGVSSAPREPKTSSTTRICTSKYSLELSTTCSTRSASFTSSSVERNALTRSCGSLLMNPTVSLKRHSVPFGSVILRTIGSSVAKSLSSASASAPESRLSRVDLPALV